MGPGSAAAENATKGGRKAWAGMRGEVGRRESREKGSRGRDDGLKPKVGVGLGEAYSDWLRDEVSGRLP